MNVRVRESERERVFKSVKLYNLQKDDRKIKKTTDDRNKERRKEEKGQT